MYFIAHLHHRYIYINLYNLSVLQTLTLEMSSRHKHVWTHLFTMIRFVYIIRYLTECKQRNRFCHHSVTSPDPLYRPVPFYSSVQYYCSQLRYRGWGGGSIICTLNLFTCFQHFSGKAINCVLCSLVTSSNGVSSSVFFGFRCRLYWLFLGPVWHFHGNGFIE